MSDAGLHPQAHSANVLEGKSLAALIHEGDAWGESLAVLSRVRRGALCLLAPLKV